MFRFTIRDVLWLTVVVAMAIGWGMDSRIRRHLAADFESHDGELRAKNFILGTKCDEQRQRIEYLETLTKRLFQEVEMMGPLAQKPSPDEN